MASETVKLLGAPRVRDFLSTARVASLASVDEAGAPHSVPICFWFEEARFYFVIDLKPKRRSGMGLKRMRNIAKDPRVALLISHYEDQWSSLAYALIRGVARVVEDPNEYLLALRNLRDKYPQYRSMALVPEHNPIVRIEASRVHVWGERFSPQAAAEAKP